MVSRVSELVESFHRDLEAYRSRHSGREPARVFVNAAMCDLLQYAPMTELAAARRPEDRSDRRDSMALLGCRYTAYWDSQSDPQYFFTDQEE